MKLVEKIGLSYLHRLDPELAHDKSLRFLNLGLGPKTGPYRSARIQTQLAGLHLPNPVGLAAGYDKNAIAVDALGRAGFGFLEVGAITPQAQVGNRPPRVFRLPEDQAIINRLGFNNEGMYAIAERLRTRKSNAIVGVNLGANRDSKNRVFDYVDVLARVGKYADFATINISSPNTERLRELQSTQALEHLLDGVIQTRNSLTKPIPIFLKIAPDLDDQELFKIAQTALHMQVDGIIATNTTVDRKGLNSKDADQIGGGLSGRPLFAKSTRVLAVLAKELDGALPLIGVGGISSAQDAFDKITAGASAVQLYSAMIYQGISLVNDIAKGLDRLLQENGFNHISDAVGSDIDRFL